MSGSRAHVEVYVGAAGPLHGVLTIEQEWIPIRSERQDRPDHKWVLVDNAGHWHAFTKDGKLPTLRDYQEHVECDGSCAGVCEGEGYHVTRWKCRACGRPVTPRFIREYDVTTTIPGPTSWHVQVMTTPYGFPLPNYPEQVSVRATVEGRTFFGLATLGDWSMSSDTLEATLCGVSELGERAA